MLARATNTVSDREQIAGHVQSLSQPRKSVMSTMPVVSSSLELRRRAVWPLKPGLVYLNHGSYGSCPAYVLERQEELRRRMEYDPTQFFKVDLEGLCDRARDGLSRFINCQPQDLAFMPNGTVAVAVALHSVPLQPGDEVLVTDHEYSATMNELERLCARSGARIVRAHIAVPVTDDDSILGPVLAAITPRTKLIVVSHISSASAIIFPARKLAHAARERGIEILLDGAHTPGQVRIDIADLQPTFYAASCHKWLGAPKGTGFLYVSRHIQPRVRPLSLSCRTHIKRTDRAPFLCDFDYVGTNDYTANLVIPDAIEHVGSQVRGGWDELMVRNHEKIMEARTLVCAQCPVSPLAPEPMIGSMASVALPANPDPTRDCDYDDPLQDALLKKHNIQIPVWDMPGIAPRVMRLSAQLYNVRSEYEQLAAALNEELNLEKALKPATY